MSWIDYDDISARIFKGEPVPGDNTMNKAEVDGIIDMVQNLVSAYFNIDPPTDYRNLVKEYCLKLFKRALEDDISPEIDEKADQMYIRKISLYINGPTLSGIGLKRRGPHVSRFEATRS